MAGEKKTGIRARTRVVVKRDQSGPEDVQKKPDTHSKVKGTTLHPDTGSPVGNFDATKAASKALERGASGVEAIFRSIAKEVIKGGIVVGELASETGEKFKDLLTEAKSELETSKTQTQEINKTEGNDGK
jgi:hypothetical protein